MNYTAGPGDDATWPEQRGHPHDPRSPEDDGDDATAWAIADVRCFLVVAELAAKRGEFAKAREALREVKLSIEDLIGDDE